MWSRTRVNPLLQEYISMHSGTDASDTITLSGNSMRFITEDPLSRASRNISWTATIRREESPELVLPDNIQNNEDLERFLSSFKELPYSDYTRYGMLLRERKEKMERDRIAWLKANGMKFVKLHKIYWKNREVPLEDAVRVKIERKQGWIFKKDAKTSLEWEVFHTNFRPYHIQKIVENDVNWWPQYSSKWKRIRNGQGAYFYHDYEGIKTIRYRWEDFEKSWAVRNLNLVQCGECGDWRQKGDNASWTPTCHCQNPNLDRYHTSYWADKNVLNSEDSRFRAGIEMEKGWVLDDAQHLSLKSKKWRCETDSTVSAEYITPILPLDDVNKCVGWIMNTGECVVNAPISGSCWGHIHLSVKDERPEDTYERIRWYRPLLWSLYPERAEGGWSNRNIWDDDYTSHNADVWVRQNTVEIRIFPWLDSERKLRFRLELCKYMLEHPRNTVKGALKAIISDTKLHEILKIAYGDNTVRMREFFSRLRKFYTVKTDEMTSEVNRIADSIMLSKERGKTPEEMDTVRNLITNL